MHVGCIHVCDTAPRCSKQRPLGAQLSQRASQGALLAATVAAGLTGGGLSTRSTTYSTACAPHSTAPQRGTGRHREMACGGEQRMVCNGMAGVKLDTMRTLARWRTSHYCVSPCPSRLSLSLFGPWASSLHQRCAAAQTSALLCTVYIAHLSSLDLLVLEHGGKVGGVGEGLLAVDVDDAGRAAAGKGRGGGARGRQAGRIGEDASGSCCGHKKRGAFRPRIRYSSPRQRPLPFPPTLPYVGWEAWRRR